MKRLILTTILATLAIMPLSSQAQLTFRSVNENSNQMSVRVGGYELLLEQGVRSFNKHNRTKSRRPYGGRIGTWEIGFNGFGTSGNSYSLYPEQEKGFMDLNMAKSLNITLNLFTFSTSFTPRNVLGLTMGIGLASNNYVFDTPARYAKIDKIIRPIEPETDLKKAKLSTFAVHIPLALEINPSRNFFISFGGYADFIFKSRLKSKFPKEKLWNPYTNSLQAGVTARVGFRNIYLFANYGLLDMFKDGHAPVLNPYTFGFGFGF
jgi:hypothetical protein